MPPNRQFDPGLPVLIYGAGQFARSVAGALQQVGVPVAGFVVAKPAVSTLMDCPVWSWSCLAEVADVRGMPLLCGIFNRNDPYLQLDAIARGHGFEAMLMPWDYYPALAASLGWRYWLSERPQTLATVEHGPAQLQRVHGLLYDAESQVLLRRMIAPVTGCSAARGKARPSAPLLTERRSRVLWCMLYAPMTSTPHSGLMLSRSMPRVLIWLALRAWPASCRAAALLWLWRCTTVLGI